MYTLLLNLSAPMQSWGTDSVYNTRRTQKEPTKSGVIGLVAGAMGRKRSDPVDDLARLRFGVRVDQPGEVHRDYQTVKSRINKSDAFISNRFYINDGAFLVGLESGDREFLEEISKSLQSPAFAPFLGRRSCPPAFPLLRGIRDAGLEDALRDEPWIAAPWRRKNLEKDLPLYIESDGTTEYETLQRDVPVSFDSRGRKYGFRYVRFAGTVCMQPEEAKADAPAGHDPMQELKDAGSEAHDPMSELRRE